jgi:hypothetical protein
LRGAVRKQQEVKEIDEVKETKERSAARRTGRLGGGAVDQSRPMLALITLFVKYNNGTNI